MAKPEHRGFIFSQTSWEVSGSVWLKYRIILMNYTFMKTSSLETKCFLKKLICHLKIVRSLNLNFRSQMTRFQFWITAFTASPACRQWILLNFPPIILRNWGRHSQCSMEVSTLSRAPMINWPWLKQEVDPNRSSSIWRKFKECWNVTTVHFKSDETDECEEWGGHLRAVSSL